MCVCSPNLSIAVTDLLHRLRLSLLLLYWLMHRLRLSILVVSRLLHNLKLSKLAFHCILSGLRLSNLGLSVLVGWLTSISLGSRGILGACGLVGPSAEAFSSDPPCQIHVLLHDSDTFSVDGTELSVLEESNHESFTSFLDGFKS